MSWVSNGFVATGEAVWRLCIFTTKISSIGVLRNMGGWTSMERLGLEGAVVPGPSLDVCVVVVLFVAVAAVFRSAGTAWPQDSLWRVAFSVLAVVESLEIPVNPCLM